MANERFWSGIATQAFISNGGSEGQVQVLSTRNIKVKMKVFVSANAQTQLNLEVKKVLNSTDLVLGPIGGAMRGTESTTNLSTYTTSANAKIRIDEQQRPSIIPNEIIRAIYDEEPTMAVRTVAVDEWGNKYTTNNPLPVQLSDGSVNIGTVNADIEVQLSHKNNDPAAGDVADSVRIGDGTEELEINSDKEALVHDQDTHDKLDTLNSTLETKADDIIEKLETVQDTLVSEFDETQEKLDTLIENQTTSHGKHDASNNALASIKNNLDTIISHVDGLEGFTDGIEGLLTTIKDNADTVESLLAAVGTNTDGIEGLQTATNALLTTIKDNADQLEGYTDGLEALVTASNALLTTIRDNADQVEGYTDGIEALIANTNSLLTTIRDNADTVETLITNSNSLLTALGNNTDTVETLITNSNALLTTIRDNADSVETLLTALGNNTDQLESFVDGVETLLTAIRDNADTVETKLDDLKIEIDSSNYTMNEAFNRAQAIAGQLDDAGPVVATEGNVAPVRITPQRAMHSNLRDQSGNELVGQKPMAASVPVTISSDQTPIKTVQDVSGRPFYVEDYISLLAEQSKSFIYTTNNASKGTAESPLILLRNPTGSGKTLLVHRIMFAGAGTFRVYFMPTVTANGTAQTVVNKRLVSGAQGNSAQVFLNPTTSANGNLAYTIPVSAQAGSVRVEFEAEIVLPENTALLITTVMGANGTITNTAIGWSEV